MDFITAMLKAQNQRDLRAVKQYCIEQGYPEDYENIFLPLYKKYDWEFIRDIGGIEWERIDIYNYKVTYLNLDRLSLFVEYDEVKGKFVPIKG